MAKLPWCVREGLEHVWFSFLTSRFQIIKNDWCVNCGEPADPRDHVFVKGKSRPIDDVETPDGLL